MSCPQVIFAFTQQALSTTETLYSEPRVDYRTVARDAIISWAQFQFA